MRDVGGCCAVIEPGLSGALDRWHLAMPSVIVWDGRGDCERHRRLDAIWLAARLEAMITYPVYEGKSMAGLIDLVSRGEIDRSSKVLYAHLGGQHRPLVALHRDPTTRLAALSTW